MDAINTSRQFEQASIYSDLNSLDAIRQQGLSDEAGALKKAAKEFEAFFLNLMLKSMRQASEVIGGDSLFSSQQEKMFTSMLDEQLSIDLSQKGTLGISELMMAQLMRQKGSLSAMDSTKEKQINDQDSLVSELTTSVKERFNLDKSSSIDGVSDSVSLKSAEPSNPIDAIDVTNVVLAQSNLATKNSSFLTSEDEKRKVDSADSALVNKTVVNTNVINTEVVKPEKKSLFSEAKEFVAELWPYAKAAAQKLNLEPKLLIAQAALETGWGKFIMHDNSGKPGFNLFGIKAGNNWKGESINIDTLEVEAQQVHKVNASFRKYQNFSESFNDYVDFISGSPRYQKALESSESPNVYIQELQDSGYATDPNYANKILRILGEDVIQKVDSGE
ncbi:flagellar assembly peptidoglycan hydrolase FlgJ [Aliikangiella coralliicola]|uniref:Peptidoglycan hydrolase FlgJ n=1 Tax=Aliikangiella coralliicola TaxID=2592383 RepID=A0A545U5Y0_9GAMM|nr:flagellar assembly peptidoglycan hydrolase FlgJ [Aliikangiella coralliicola]TQV84866.1 flagellar assembly peptidoglycan hydrolase FlgJ [Aliikangiella coralliicola]